MDESGHGFGLEVMRKSKFKKNLKKIKKACESGFPYCFLTDVAKFFLWGSMLLDFSFLAEEVSWIYRIFKICCHDKKNKIQIRLKGLDRFSQNSVSNITQY